MNKIVVLIICLLPSFFYNYVLAKETSGLPFFLTTESGFADKKIVVQLHLDIAGQSRANNNIRSFIRRELRSLGDIELIEAASIDIVGDVAIQILVMENRLLDGRLTGFTYSVTSLVASYDRRFWMFYENTLFTSSTDVRNICIDIVSWFDTGLLESYRRW